jgi:hypothetical protein
MAPGNAVSGIVGFEANKIIYVTRIAEFCFVQLQIIGFGK